MSQHNFFHTINQKISSIEVIVIRRKIWIAISVGEWGVKVKVFLKSEHNFMHDDHQLRL